jgi:hypothetical protein
MVLYHATTARKAKMYNTTGRIVAPVRGFDSVTGALAWACKVGRKVILEIEVEPARVYKLPDHHNAFGTAFFTDTDVTKWTGIFHGEKGFQ